MRGSGSAQRIPCTHTHAGWRQNIKCELSLPLPFSLITTTAATSNNYFQIEVELVFILLPIGLSCPWCGCLRDVTPLSQEKSYACIDCTYRMRHEDNHKFLCGSQVTILITAAFVPACPTLARRARGTPAVATCSRLAEVAKVDLLRLPASRCQTCRPWRNSRICLRPHRPRHCRRSTRPSGGTLECTMIRDRP